MRPRLSKSVDPREIELKFYLPPGSRAALEASPALAAAEPSERHLN